MIYSIQILQHEPNAQMQTGEASKLIFATRFVTDNLNLDFTEKVTNLVKEEVKPMTKEEYEKKDKVGS